MSILLNKVEIIKDVNPLKAGLVIEFSRPICFIVGDNGIGKSTIMECISDHYGFKDDTYIKRRSMKDNIRITSSGEFPIKSLDFHSGDKKFSGAFGEDIGLQIQHMKASSGQCTLSLLMHADFKPFKDGLILLDEPCRGLSIKNQWALADIISNLPKQKNCQAIVVTHSDIILKVLKEEAQYYSVGEKKDTTYKDFILSQLIS